MKLKAKKIVQMTEYEYNNLMQICKNATILTNCFIPQETPQNRKDRYWVSVFGKSLPITNSVYQSLKYLNSQKEKLGIK